MSLIYQALKQSEQQSSAVPKAVVRERSALRPAVDDAPRKQGREIALGLLVAAAGLATGYWLSPAAGVQEQPARAAALPEPMTESHPPALPAAIEKSLAPPVADLPLADQPLPTSSPRLRLAYALPTEGPRTAPVKVARPNEPATSAAPAQERMPSTAAEAAANAAEQNTPRSETPQGQVEVSLSKGAPTTNAPVPAEDLRTLFEGLNAALSQQDKPLAQLKLTSIQSRLPESSVARLRAEAWFAHQTADLDAATSIYTRLLAKIPGDELASINLASIEKKRQHTAQAKEILAKSLQQNPSSTALRAAMDQLVLSGSKP